MSHYSHTGARSGADPRAGCRLCLLPRDRQREEAPGADLLGPVPSAPSGLWSPLPAAAVSGRHGCLTNGRFPGGASPDCHPPALPLPDGCLAHASCDSSSSCIQGPGCWLPRATPQGSFCSSPPRLGCNGSLPGEFPARAAGTGRRQARGSESWLVLWQALGTDRAPACEPSRTAWEVRSRPSPLLGSDSGPNINRPWRPPVAFLSLSHHTPWAKWSHSLGAQ